MQIAKAVLLKSNLEFRVGRLGLVLRFGLVSAGTGFVQLQADGVVGLADAIHVDCAAAAVVGRRPVRHVVLPSLRQVGAPLDLSLGRGAGAGVTRIVQFANLADRGTAGRRVLVVRRRGRQ